MKTLAALILEDYLKFRGALLIYVLAALLDQQREIKELAVELIMKYTTEKSDIFLRTCLVECPFVFNACPCFGQGTSAVTRSGSILKGATKRGAREYIYSYLIRKIEPVHLYMYFGNIARLNECIQKDAELLDSSDFQSAIMDFLFVCSEICVVNEKQKKNLEKIVKENHDGEGIAINDDDEAAAIDKAATTSAAADAGDGEKKGRGGKKNQPTLKQSLATVEKIVPLISSIDSSLRLVNQTIFQPVLDKFCTNMCIHFESLLEYAQPREFWAPYLKKAKESAPVAAPKHTKKAPPKVVAEVMQPPCTIPSRSDTPKPSKRKENDSGHFTLDYDDDQSSKRSSSRAGTTRRCASRASNRTASQSSDMSTVQTPKSGRKRIASIDIDSQNDSDNESIFSDLSDITEASQLRKNTRTDSSKKKAKKTTVPPTPKTPATRKSSRR